MGFPKVKSLLCLNLRTGTFLIACLSLVGNMGCFLFFLYTLVIDLRVMEVTFGNTLALVVDRELKNVDFFTSSDLFCTTGRKTDTSSDGDHFLEHRGWSLHRWDDHQQFAHPRDQNLFLDLLRILAGLGLPLSHIQHLHPCRRRGPGLQQHRLRGGLAPVLLDRGQPGRDHDRQLLLDRCQLDEKGDEELQDGEQQPSHIRVRVMKRVWRVFYRDKMQKTHIYCEIDSGF